MKRRSSPGEVAPARSVFNPATIIVVCALGLTFLGLTILFSASASFKQGPYFYLNKQIGGEELGLWFTLGVVAVFLIMFIAGLIHLRRAPNLFQFLLVTGCLLLMCLQAIVNIGVVTGVFPTKGMSLPFISAGLSNLLLMGLLVGIIVNTQRSWPRAALPSRHRTMREVLA
jgi:cell division protein FtsW (lipid II flippase)